VRLVYTKIGRVPLRARQSLKLKRLPARLLPTELSTDVSFVMRCRDTGYTTLLHKSQPAQSLAGLTSRPLAGLEGSTTYWKESVSPLSEYGIGKLKNHGRSRDHHETRERDGFAKGQPSRVTRYSNKNSEHSCRGSHSSLTDVESFALCVLLKHRVSLRLQSGLAGNERPTKTLACCILARLNSQRL
jgi:hypothetical protein